MLFNTLAYAKFFAIVFGVAWVLVNRRWAVLLPWFALAGYVLFRPSLLGGGLSVIALGLSLTLTRRLPDSALSSADASPDAASGGDAPRLPLRHAVAGTLLNWIALCWLTYEDQGVDPATLALRALGLPLPAHFAFNAFMAASAAALGVAFIRARKVRLLFILLASYVFYAHWDWRFLPLIWGSSTADWLLGNAIAGSTTPRRRKLWVVGTVLVNLGVLGVFKYFNFGIDTAAAALRALGAEPPEVALRVALPVGISFFTFESMSYVIDIYRGDIRPQKSYFEYLSFVAFFPHLVAGPIVRPRDLLPQLAGPARWNSAEGSEGLFLISTGLLKKVAIGDYLALNLIDRVFDAPLQYSALECYTVVVAYAVQIYCDFSGYTDIAIGSALLLGIRFPLNFDAPYKAQDIQDFWRRWHISLSTWLRDYLYIPLGGNRRGRGRTYVNLMITMLLGGLWHGAAWTFVVWGGLHGAALAVTRAFVTYRAERGIQPLASPGAVALRVALTFHFVCATWVFFRAETFQKAWLMFGQIGTLTHYAPNLHWQVLAILAVGLITHWAPEKWYVRVREGFIGMPAPAQGAALLAAALGLRQMATADAVPFVYFQF